MCQTDGLQAGSSIDQSRIKLFQDMQVWDRIKHSRRLEIEMIDMIKRGQIGLKAMHKQTCMSNLELVKDTEVFHLFRSWLLNKVREDRCDYTVSLYLKTYQIYMIVISKK